MPRKSRKIRKKKEGGCDLCKKDIVDNVNLGEMKRIGELNVHYYCLLLSTNVPQNGSDSQGIFGFLESDIQSCIERDKRNNCFYCHKHSATIFCSKQRCYRTFHVSCGLKNNCLFQFVDKFESFCDKHWSIEEPKPFTHGNCLICCEALGQYDPLKIAPTCCGIGWTHTSCLREFALSSGYFFKCVMCGKRKEEYVRIVRMRGIFVPDQDASWEQEEMAYTSLLYVYDRCDAVNCICEYGRTYFEEEPTDLYYIQVCVGCGGAGVHRACNPLNGDSFSCNTCNVQQEKELSDLLLNGEASNPVIEEASLELDPNETIANAEEDSVQSSSAQEPEEDLPHVDFLNLEDALDLNFAFIGDYSVQLSPERSDTDSDLRESQSENLPLNANEAQSNHIAEETVNKDTSPALQNSILLFSDDLSCEEDGDQSIASPTSSINDSDEYEIIPTKYKSFEQAQTPNGGIKLTTENGVSRSPNESGAERSQDQNTATEKPSVECESVPPKLKQCNNIPTIDLTEDSNMDVDIDDLINDMQKESVIIPRPIQLTQSRMRRIEKNKEINVIHESPILEASSFRDRRLRLLFLDRAAYSRHSWHEFSC